MTKISFAKFKDFIKNSLLGFISDEELNELYLVMTQAGIDSHQRIPREEQPQNLYFIYEGEVIQKQRYYGHEMGRARVGQSLEFKTMLMKQTQWNFEWFAESSVIVLRIPWAKIGMILGKYPQHVSYLTKLVQSVVLQRFKRDFISLGFSHDFIVSIVSKFQLVTSQNFSKALFQTRLFFVMASGEIVIRKGGRILKLSEVSYVTGNYDFIVGLDETSDFEVLLNEGTKLFVLSEKELKELESTPEFDRFISFESKMKFRPLNIMGSDPETESKVKIATSKNNEFTSTELTAVFNQPLDGLTKKIGNSFQSALDENGSQGKVACVQNLLKSFNSHLNVFDLLNRHLMFNLMSIHQFKDLLTAMGFECEIVKGDWTPVGGEKWISTDVSVNFHLFKTEKNGDVTIHDAEFGSRSSQNMVDLKNQLVNSAVIKVNSLNKDQLQIFMQNQLQELAKVDQNKSELIVNSGGHRFQIGFMTLFGFVGEKKQELLLLFALGLLSYVFSLAFPLATQYLLDQVIQHGRIERLPYLAIGLLVMSVLGSYFDFMIQKLNSYMSSLMSLRFKAFLHSNLLSGFHHDWLRRSKLISRMTEVDNLCSTVMNQIFPIFSNLVLSFFTIYIAYCYAPIFAVTFAASIPLTFLFVHLGQSKIQGIKAFGIYARERETDSYINAYDRYEQVSLHRQNILDRWRIERSIEQTNRYTLWSALSNSALQILQMLKSEAIRLVTFFLAMKLHLSSQLTLGQVLALTMLAPRMGSLLQTIVNTHFQYLNLRVVLESISNVTITTAAKSQLQNSDNAIRSELSPELAQFIEKTNSDSLVVVGYNESGRHEQMGELVKFLREKMQNAPSAQAKTVAVVGQDFGLFTGTLLFNLTFDERSPDIARLMKIVSGLGFESLLMNRPEGLNLAVMGLSNQFSPSEIIKIQIVRSIYLNTAYMIFDQINQYFDHITEFEVFNQIVHLCPNSKIIWSTSNLGIASKSRSVLYYADGKVICAGPHFELVKNNENYLTYFALHAIAG